MKSADHIRAISLSRFLLAVRAIAWLAEADAVCPSALIADSVHAHATFLRRLFAPLVRSGVAEVREGRIGGYALGRAPDQITLADIYRATRHFGEGTCETPADTGSCAPDLPIDRALEEIIRLGEARFTEVLSEYTIADLLRMASPRSSR